MKNRTTDLRIFNPTDSLVAARYSLISGIVESIMSRIPEFNTALRSRILVTRERRTDGTQLRVQNYIQRDVYNSLKCSVETKNTSIHNVI